MEATGDLCNIRGEFEWKIKNFLQLSGYVYPSPKFSFCGIPWVLWIYPNRYIDDAKVKWIDLYIDSKSVTLPISVDVSFHFKTVDGKADTYAKFKCTHVFDKENCGCGRDKFIARTELIERKSELLSSGVLTVICTLKKSNTSSARGIPVHQFTQTEEGTGILKLQQHFKEILLNGNVSDVVLKVEDQEFKSHRCVLAARSPVFQAMMTHDTKEKNTGVVDIQDVDSSTFSDFLKYLYTGSEEIVTPESVVKLYNAADKYQVDELKQRCLGYMLTNISVDIFCDVLSLSLEHVEKDLTDTCSQFFINNSLAIISTPKWLTFLKDNLVAGNELYMKQLKNSMKVKN